MTVWTRGENPWLSSCAQPGCENKVQKGKFDLCYEHEPLVCSCPVAYSDSIGQCTRCWRVITHHSAHPILADGWPELADQPIRYQMQESAAS